MSVCTNIFQQVFCLSMQICAAATQQGDETSLQTYLQGQLQDLLDNPDFNNGDSWSIVWGPAVWQAPSSTWCDQALAVLYNSTQKTYVVPLSATNPRSSYNVFYEDLAVVPFYMQPVGTGAGNVSVGNYAALQVLLSLTSGTTAQTVQQFLAATANSNDDLVICGHSLGGGLTPLMAYSLYNNGTSGSGWNNVYTYPTAGPTTADGGFQSAFDAAYPVTNINGGYQMWNANQYNVRDIVPNAWSGSSTAPGLSQIDASIWWWVESAMYYTTAKIEVEVDVLNEIATALAGGSDNPYVSTNNNALFTGARQNGQIGDVATLAKEIDYQHIDAYIAEFGVSALFPPATASTMIQAPLRPLVAGLVPGTLATAMAPLVEAQKPAQPEPVRDPATA